MGKVSKKNKEPLISVIVPVYNGEKYIKTTLDLLLKVDCPKEIIVINDCSKDSSAKILSEYKDSIKLFSLEKNMGVSNARNLGIANAIGEYICFVDIDDSIELDMYPKMLKKIKEDSFDVCVCNYNEIFEGSDKTVKSKYSFENEFLNHKEALSKFLLDKISPAIWDKMYKTEFLKNIMFDRTLAVGEDILFCLNVFLKTNKVCFIDENLYHYFQQKSSVMHTISPKLLQFKKVIENISDDDKNYLEKNFSSEYNFFKLEMITRGIHSISSLANKKNKNQAIEFLKEYYVENDLSKILKCEYFSKMIKLEIFLLKTFGIKFHLFMTPIYTFVRNTIRR